MKDRVPLFRLEFLVQGCLNEMKFHFVVRHPNGLNNYRPTLLNRFHTLMISRGHDFISTEPRVA